jgi:uncharacterized protein DUF3298/peptidoglycan-N-acetylmuramic acid deacetylase PdaC-like protein
LSIKELDIRNIMEIILSIATLLGGITAIWFFWDKYKNHHKNNTYKVKIISKEFKSENIVKHGVDVIYPSIIYKDNTFIENKINKLIKNLFARYYAIDIEKKKILSDNIGQFTSTYEQTYKIENILGFKFTNYMYSDGAAHGNVEIISSNINLQNGEEFEFKDIFRSHAKDELNLLVKQKLHEYQNEENYFDFDIITLRDNQDFYIKDNTLVIVFFKYEIACGACGPIEIKLHFSEINNFINPNGPLNFLYNHTSKNGTIPKTSSVDFALQGYLKASKKISNKTLERDKSP